MTSCHHDDVMMIRVNSFFVRDIPSYTVSAVGQQVHVKNTVSNVNILLMHWEVRICQVENGWAARTTAII